MAQPDGVRHRVQSELADNLRRPQKFAAKHEGVNEPSKAQARPPEFRPQINRITLLLRWAQDSLHHVGGTSPTYSEMEEWSGVAEGTLKDWFGNKGIPRAEFLLQLLERLPAKARHELLDASCGSCPTLEHPRWAGDQTVMSQLKSIARQAKGLTIIRGASDEHRTFSTAFR